jgi:hypothetical protein
MNELIIFSSMQVGTVVEVSELMEVPKVDFESFLDNL